MCFVIVRKKFNFLELMSLTYFKKYYFGIKFSEKVTVNYIVLIST